LFNDPPFNGGIGRLVLGGALLTGAFGPRLGGSILLQAVKPQIKIVTRIICGFSVLNIFLQVVFARWWFVRITGQRFARHSIFAFDPTAQVNKLASLRTEWTKGVVFPLGRFTAGWTLHESGTPSASMPKLQRSRSFEQYSSSDEGDRTFAAHGVQADSHTLAG
jgi:hypothetical protein